MEARREDAALLPMPRLCLAPGSTGVDRAFAGLTCAGCVPGGCALAIGREPGRDPEGRRQAMPKRESDAKRRGAFAEGLPPAKCAAARKLPGGELIEARMPELDALARIAAGEQSAWDVLAAEALAGKRSDEGCAVADGDMDACPGWCPAAIAGFEGWVMAS